jgi:hypothetical protein
MTKQWCPHIDLARLSAALSEEILAASDAEVRSLLAETEHAVATTPREVRDLIAAASGEQDEFNLKLVGSDGQRRIFVAL